MSETITPDDGDRQSGIVPEHWLPDEPVILGDWTEFPPEEWPCPNRIHVCHACGTTTEDLPYYLSHWQRDHNENEEDPMLMCSTLPADEHGEPDMEEVELLREHLR
jgi:hypothetical protein